MGTFALKNPSATNAVAITGVSNGDVLELPGSSVSNVTFGANSLTVTTNAGTYAFTHVIRERSTATPPPMTSPPGSRRSPFAARTCLQECHGGDARLGWRISVEQPGQLERRRADRGRQRQHRAVSASTISSH